MANSTRRNHPELNDRHQLKPDQKETLCAIFILNQMINMGRAYARTLDGNSQNLESLFQWMRSKGLVEASDVQVKKKTILKQAVTEYRHVPTQAGRQLLTTFLECYQEYMKLYDLYCAIDLNTGDFAFSRYFELSPDEFKVYLEDERWEDLRVAIAEFKKLDPIEIVFMSYLNESKIDTDQDGWEAQLVSDETWDKILNICNTNLSYVELGYKDRETNQNISADKVTKDIIHQGTELMFALHKQEEEQAPPQDGAEADEPATEEVIEETVVEEIRVSPYPITYYNPYWDPYYISPIWAQPLYYY